MKQTKTILSVAKLPLSLLFLLLIYGPAESYFSNVNDFSFDIYDLLVMFVPVFIVCSIVVILMLFLANLVSNRMLSILLAISLGALLAFFVQGTFFSKNLPIIDGHIIDWSDYSYMRIQSILIWLFSFVFSFGLLIFANHERFQMLSSIIGGFTLAFLLLSSALSGVFNNGFIDKDDLIITAKNLASFSDEQNFIIILDDGIDAGIFNEIIESKPEIKDSLAGFTFYKDTLSCYNYTAYSVPQILSGEKFLCQENYYLYLRRAYSESPFFKELEDAGYSLNLYSYEVPKVYSWLERFDNIKGDHTVGGFVYPVNFVKTMFKLSGIKYFPYDLKTKCNVSPVSIMGDSTKKSSADSVNSNGLREFYDLVNSTEFMSGKTKNFSFIYLDGAHPPFDTLGDLSFSDSATYYDEVEASLTSISNYLEKLKETDVFNNSVILIMADHGNARWIYNDDSGRQNPMLLVKGINEHDEFKTNNTPVSYENLLTAFGKLLNGKTAAEAFSVSDTVTQRMFYMAGDSIIGTTSIIEYVQTGQADDMSTLKETGVVYSFK